MAVKPVDRIRSMITDLERGARTLGDDIRKRAGKVTVTSDLEAALRQLMQGLTTIAVQLEKAAHELRLYLEASTKGARKASKKTGAKGKAGAKRAKAKKPKAAKAAKPAKEKKAAPAKSSKGGGKKSSKKAAAKKAAR
ncbi:MAG: hypothetical protein ABR538_10790 [Candidatus Binatia bacterium]